MTTHSTLYEQDYHQWLNETVAAIKARRFSEVDWDNLVEELVDMGKADKNALLSNLKILLAHLLKLKVQSDAPWQMKRSWYNSVDEHRERVKDALESIPSLQTYLHEALLRSYAGARKLAVKEGSRANYGVRKPNEQEYPTQCPFSLAQLLDEDFYGETDSTENH